jgi:hypothetical protein
MPAMRPQRCREERSPRVPLFSASRVQRIGGESKLGPCESALPHRASGRGGTRRGHGQKADSGLERAQPWSLTAALLICSFTRTGPARFAYHPPSVPWLVGKVETNLAESIGQGRDGRHPQGMLTGFTPSVCSGTGSLPSRSGKPEPRCFGANRCPERSGSPGAGDTSVRPRLSAGVHSRM